MRKDPLVNGAVYHIISRSIAGYKVFPDKIAFLRIIDAICFYAMANSHIKYSKYDLLSVKGKQKIIEDTTASQLINLVSYSIMPTHLHLVLKQNLDNGIFIFMRNLLNSYSRYFNTRFRRKGPLWDSHFKNILVESDEQLLHLTRYVHLNPVSAGLVDRPEDWQWSSYKEYIGEVRGSNRICKYDDLLDIDTKEYKKFVNDRISYQKELSKIKKLLLDEYGG